MSSNSYYNITFSRTRLIVLPLELQRKAQKELNEYPEKRMKDIEELRKMVLGEKTLRADTSDAFLIRFLRARKFDKDRAFQLLKSYYIHRKKVEKVSGIPLLPSTCREVADCDFVKVLPKSDQDGRYYVFFDFDKWDLASTFTFHEILRFGVLLLEKSLQVESLQINGICALLDMKMFSYGHLRRYGPYMVYLFVKVFQDAMPVRIKAVHFVRETIVFGLLWKMGRNLFSPKIRGRIHFHGDDLSSLHRYVPKEILPEELGGTLDPVDTNEIRKIFYGSEDEFKECMNNGYVKLPS